MEAFQSCAEKSINKTWIYFLLQSAGHEECEAVSAKEREKRQHRKGERRERETERHRERGELWEAVYAVLGHFVPVFDILFPDDDGLVPHPQTTSVICRTDTLL